MKLSVDLGKNSVSSMMNSERWKLNDRKLIGIYFYAYTKKHILQTTRT